MGMINHYGVTVDTSKPTTGVFQNNHIDFLGDDLANSISVGYQEMLDEFVGDRLQILQNFLDRYDPNVSEVNEKVTTALEELQNPYAHLDHCSCSEPNLIGFIPTDKESESWYWFRNLHYGYIPDPEAEFSAIVGEIYTQVIASKYILRGNLCSPCYPGQVDADSNGEILAFSFPKDSFEKDNLIFPRIFHKDVDGMTYEGGE